MEEKNNPNFQKALEIKERARELLDQKKPEEAFSLFDEAGRIFEDIGKHSYASDCYASAATCWTIRCGEKLYYNAASRYQLAAEEREKFYDYFLASYYYQQAADNFQKDISWKRYSECFYKHKDCERKEAFYLTFNPGKFKSIPGRTPNTKFNVRIKSFLKCLSTTFFCLIWGYGERPRNTILTILTIILMCTIGYYISGGLYYEGKIINPTLFDSLYFSIISFSTIGYGDYHPAGIIRALSMIEALSGIILMPLYIIALTRKYLR